MEYLKLNFSWLEESVNKTNSRVNEIEEEAESLNKYVEDMKTLFKSVDVKAKHVFQHLILFRLFFVIQY